MREETTNNIFEMTTMGHKDSIFSPAHSLLSISNRYVSSMGQLFKRSQARVQQNRVLSHFQFSQRYNVIHCVQFQ